MGGGAFSDHRRGIGDHASRLSDRPLLEEIWNTSPLMRQYLGSIDNPQLIIYRIVPRQVRYMQEWALEYYDVPFAAKKV